jgi:hypothetical protein
LIAVTIGQLINDTDPFNVNDALNHGMPQPTHGVLVNNPPTSEGQTIFEVPQELDPALIPNFQARDVPLESLSVDAQDPTTVDAAAPFGSSSGDFTDNYQPSCAFDDPCLAAQPTMDLDFAPITTCPMDDPNIIDCYPGSSDLHSMPSFPLNDFTLEVM